jgi:hypothetical protein
LKQESRKTVQKHTRFDHAETQGKMQQEMKKLTIAQYKRILENFKSQIKRKEQTLIGTDQDNVSDWGEMSIHRLLFQ